MPAPLWSDLGEAKAKAFGYGLALDDRLFRLATGPGREVTVETMEPAPPRVDTGASAEELAEEDPVFARSEFSGGEGQFRAHVAGASADRFWDSRNVSVSPADPGEFPQVTLLHGTEQIEASATTGLRLAYDDVAGSLYMCEGNVLRRSDNPTAESAVFADDDPHAGEGAATVLDVAVLGSETYAAVGANGIHKKSGTWSHWADNPASETYQRVWSVKGRIVASTGRSLYEVVASGAAPAATKTLAVGETWLDVADGGSHVLAAASDGYVYSFSTDSGSLALSSQTPFEGEVPRCVGQTQGVVAVGTWDGAKGRWYVGGLREADGLIIDQQLVKEWSGQSPRAVLGGLRESLFTAVPDGTDTHLWRYDVRSGGVSRSYTVDGVSSDCYGLVAISGKPYFTVESSGLWRQSSTYASEGWLMSPLADFLSSDDKSWVGARLETGALSAGMVVELFYTTDPDALSDPDSSSWTRVVRRDGGTGDPGEVGLNGVVARSIAGMVRLSPSTDASATPAVRSFSFRAYPSSGDEDLIVTVPVNISDQVERFGRARSRVRGRGDRELTALLSYESRPVLARVLSDDLIVRGVVQKVQVPRQTERRRGSPTAVALVTIRGKRTGTGVSVESVGTFASRRPFASRTVFAGRN